MVIHAKIETHILRSICDIIGDTASGLTGSQIGKYLRDSSIYDPLPGITKRDRLFEALHQRQELDTCSNNVLAFIQKVMHPSNYTADVVLFDERRGSLNGQLGFIGLRISERGNFEPVAIAATIDEAKERAGRLRKKLFDRRIHHEVLKFCREELVQENYFHAVLEATKSIFDRIRQQTGFVEDGRNLIVKAFNLGSDNHPKLAFNPLVDHSEVSEHKGFINFLTGVYGMFRNVTAHTPKIKWAINEDDAVEALAVISFAHKKLDDCHRTPW